jgi:quinol monooxygenase YgiN
MITEIARIGVVPGSEAAFEAAVREAVPIFLAAPGCRGVELQRSVEAPQFYLLFAKWDRVEDHTDVFRSSTAFERWRELVGPHTIMPTVEHVRPIQL